MYSQLLGNDVNGMYIKVQFIPLLEIITLLLPCFATAANKQSFGDQQIHVQSAFSIVLTTQV